MNVKINLAEVWQQNYIPKEGDQLQVYCKDIDEFAVKVSIMEVSPARYYKFVYLKTKSKIGQVS